MTSATNTRQTLKELVAAYMRSHHLRTVASFADHIGLSRSTIYDLISGKENLPSVTTLITLAHALDKPTHELLYLAVPDAPGAPDVPMIPARTAAALRLKQLGQVLPDIDTFLKERREDDRE